METFQPVGMSDIVKSIDCRFAGEAVEDEVDDGAADEEDVFGRVVPLEPDPAELHPATISARKNRTPERRMRRRYLGSLP